MTTITRLRGSGFTLLEIMVVVVIIGIITAIATLSIGVASRDQGTGKEVQRLDDMLALAGEQAVLQGREYGLTFYAHQYEFSAYDYESGRWQPVEDDLPLATRKLPQDAVVDLYVDGRQVAVAAERPKRDKARDKAQDKPAAGANAKAARKSAGEDEKDKLTPQVFIMSSGDVTPFEVRLRPGIGQPGIVLRVADNGETRQVPDDK